MIVKQFLDEVEQHFEDPVALRGIRKRAARDKSLSDDDRASIDERIGMYLADHDGVAAPGSGASELPEPLEGVELSSTLAEMREDERF